MGLSLPVEAGEIADQCSKGVEMMADLERLCKACGKPTPITPFMTCDDCLQERKKVLNFVQKHPSANPMDVSERTNVPIEKVSNMLRQGILTQK